MGWPDWWSWELQLTPHLKERMVDRGFAEIDLREMLGWSMLRDAAATSSAAAGLSKPGTAGGLGRWSWNRTTAPDS